MYTYNIKDMYMSININQAIEEIRFSIIMKCDQEYANILIENFIFINENLYVEYEEIIAKQISGLGMGTIDGGSAADITVYYYEFHHYDIIQNFLIYKRLKDDILIISNDQHME